MRHIDTTYVLVIIAVGAGGTWQLRPDYLHFEKKYGIDWRKLVVNFTLYHNYDPRIHIFCKAVT